MNPRRVLIDAMVVRPQPTGVGRVALDLLRAMSADPRGLDVRVVTSHPEMFPFLAGRPEWGIVAVPPRNGMARNAVFLQTSLPRLLSREGAGMVHSLNMVAPLAARCPVLLTVHDIAFHLHPGTVEQPRRSYYRLMVPLSVRKAALVGCVSAATRDELTRYSPAAAGKSLVLPNAVPGWTEGREPGGPRPSDAPFLFVGTLEPRKNLERILAAYERFLAVESGKGRIDELPDLVVVGGRGWRDSGLRRRIEALKGTGKLRLQGYCGPDILWSHYLSAQALLFPSLHEGFGLPILEAMTAGLPVLTSDRGAMREVAGDAALTVDPENVAAIAEGMSRLHSDSALRAELAGRGLGRRELWTWQQTARRTLEAYHRILG